MVNECMGKDVLGIPINHSVENSDQYSDYFKELYLFINNKKFIGNQLNRYISGESHEFKPSSVAEIHILTNAIKDYDCAFLARFSIALNVLNDITYFYYIPSGDAGDFNTLKERIKDLVKKESTTLDYVDRWLRSQYYSNVQFVCEYLDEFADCGLERTIQRVVAWKNLHNPTTRMLRNIRDNLNCFTQGGFQQDKLTFEKLKSWLHGNSETTDSIKQEISALKNIAFWLQEDSLTLSKDSVIFLKIIDEMVALLDISEEILSATLGDVRKYERFSIPRQVIQWLKTDTQDNIGSVETHLQSIFIEPDNLDITICYNFCLIINNGGAIDGASWYAVSSRESIDTIKDNYVLLYLFAGDEQKRVLHGFKYLKEKYGKDIKSEI